MDKITRRFARKRLFLPALLLASVTLPVAIVVACGTTIPAVAPDPSEKAFADSETTINDILTTLKAQEITPVSTNLLNEIKTISAETLYEQEFVASKNLQQEYFAYSKIDLLDRKWQVAKTILSELSTTATATTSAEKEAEVARAKTLGNTPPNNDNATVKTGLSSIADFESQENQLASRTNALADDIAQKTALNYDATNFFSDYPQIITPLQKIKDTQRRVYNEAREAFINGYGTRSAGEAAWVAARASRYSNAKTDDEAVNVLISRAITTIAFGRFSYSWNSAFTVKQVLSGAFSQFRKVNDKYVFGANGGGYFTKDATNENGTVYFLARSTKQAASIVVNPLDPAVGENESALEQFAARKIIGVQHALVDIKAAAGDTLPWTVTKATIKNLLQYYGPNASTGGAVFDLWANVFQTANDPKNDNIFLKFYSNNEESTKEKSGNLGINALAWWIQNMDPGFGLGIVAARSQNPAHVAKPYPAAEVGYFGQGTDGLATGKTILAKLKADLLATVNTLELTGESQFSERNRKINQHIDNMSDTEFNQRYGAIFRDVFNTYRGLVYEIDAAQNVYLVRSNFGLHTIKINEYSDATVLRNEIDKDLALIADRDSTTAAVVQWSSIFSQIYNDQTIVKELISNDALMKEIKLDTSANFKAANPTKYQEWLDNDYLKSSEDILARVRSTITNLERNDVINSSITALNNKVTYLITNLDNRFLNETIRPEVIYNAALEEMGATS